MDLVIKLGERGFDRVLVDNSLANLRQEITRLLANYAVEIHTALRDPDQDHPSWRDFCDR